ncbi:MAG: hypothetical protein Q9191_005342 [Dirinaria sp. TL-2023a]
MKLSFYPTLVLALLPLLAKAAYNPSTDPNFTGPVTNAANYVDRPGFCGNADTPPTSCSFTAGDNDKGTNYVYHIPIAGIKSVEVG